MRLGLWYLGRRGGGARHALDWSRALLENGTSISVSIVANELADQFRALEREHAPRMVLRQSTINPRSLVDLVRRDVRWFQAQGVRAVVGTMTHPAIWPMAVLSLRAGLVFLPVVHDGMTHEGDRVGLAHRSLVRAARTSQSVIVMSRHVESLVHDWDPCIRPILVPLGKLGPLQSRPDADDRYASPFMHALFLGRIRPYKGLGVLLEAWFEVERRGGGKRLTIAGEGDLVPYREALARLNNVRVVNRWLSDVEIEAHLSSATVLVAPYLEASQSGLFALAATHELPVVGSRTGGLVEQLPESALVVPGDSDDLVRALMAPHVGAVPVVASSFDVAAALRFAVETAIRFATDGPGNDPWRGKR